MNPKLSNRVAITVLYVIASTIVVILAALLGTSSLVAYRH